MRNPNKPVFGANEPQMGSKIYSATPRYRGDMLPDERKQEIREGIAKAKAKLATLSEIEKTELALRNSRLNPSIDWSL
jgi:hypothetical protein